MGIVQHYTSGSGMIPAFHVMLMNIKRLQKTLTCRKTALVTPIQNKAEKYLVKNYRLISSSNFDSNNIQICLCDALYDRYSKFLTKRQHGFVRQMSTVTNMLTFLQNRFIKRLKKIVARKLLPSVLIFQSF